MMATIGTEVVQRLEARETPLAAALGFHTLSVSEERDRFGADRVSAISDNEGSGLCGAAMLAFADHALGARVVRANQGTSTSTVDLRAEWIADLPATGAIEAVARSLAPRNGIVFAEAQLIGTDGPFARVNGAFAAGVLPGGERQPFEAARDSWNLVERPDFHSFTEAEWQGDVFVLPHLPHLVGAKELPAFHGGAVAGALHLAASDRARAWTEDRLAVSMAMRFLRPALALQPVRIACEAERLGKRMATIRCRAEQNDRELAVAEFVFWHADSRP